MGYLKNHLATLVMGVFAAVLSGLWLYFNGFAPVLDFIFLMAVPISWFLVAVLWLAQVSTNYMHPPGSEHAHDGEAQPTVVHASEEGASESAVDQVQAARAELTGELEDLKKNIKMKDSEIDSLKKQIENLETRVEIESIRAELANLRSLAARED